MNIVNRVKRRIRREMQFRRLISRRDHEFRMDPNYRLDQVEQCFADRLSKPADDTVVLKRIATAYNKAKEAQKTAPASYQVSNEWLPIYERHLMDVMQALQNEDFGALHQIYGNFMRDPCSTGLLGLPVDMQKCFFSGQISLLNKKLYLSDCLHRYRYWQAELKHAYDVATLTSPLVGNPYGYFIDGVFVKIGSDYLHYYAATIGNLLRSIDRPVVIELGGGYGGMAYYLVRDNSGMPYVDFDLPENLALTAYYLLKAFPDKKVVLYGEAVLTPELVHSHDIILMPSFEMPQLPNSCSDLIFNSYSLAEMSPEAVSTYIGHIMRLTRRYFFHVNHTRNSQVVADDFGIDPNLFDLVYKKPALWNAATNPNRDEYEYLYKKRT